MGVGVEVGASVGVKVGVNVGVGEGNGVGVEVGRGVGVGVQPQRSNNRAKTAGNCLISSSICILTAEGEEVVKGMCRPYFSSSRAF